MGKTCIILGSASVDDQTYLEMGLEVVLTGHGKVRFYKDGDVYYLQRHSGNTPPHMICHKAHITAIKELGIKDIIAVNSCGSLKKDIVPGSLLIPDDYIDLANILSFHDDEMIFTVPGLSQTLRKRIRDAAKKAKIPVIDKGTYIQARGPRFETKAEVMFYSTIADVVGMTMASEATLAKELKLNYASICAVDNYGNGIGKKLSIKDIEAARQKTVCSLKKLINSVCRKVTG